MVLLIVSWLVVHQHAAAFGLLLAATACLGAGFGLSVPSLNTLAAALHPAAVDRSVLVLNSLLGLGTALAPAFVAAFIGLGFLDRAAGARRLPLVAPVRRQPAAAPGSWCAPPGFACRPRARGIPAGFWVFAAFAVLYGFCETMNGNWSQLDLASLGVRPAVASLALTVFWAVVTAGRVLLAAIQRWLPSRAAYHGLPFLLAERSCSSRCCRPCSRRGVAAFCLAGLGCSALLPLTISFGQRKLADRRRWSRAG